MLVSSIEPLPFSKKKNRFKVRLIDGTNFVLYKKEIDKYDIRENEELSEDDYNEILSEIFIPRAKMRAMHLLEKQDRTENNLRSKLRESGYPLAAIDVAIEYVSNYNYINDARYTENYIRIKSQTKSKRRIIDELLQKGISKDLIYEIIEYLESNEDYEIFNERAIISDYVQRKLSDVEINDKIKNKVYSHLLRQGFNSSDILSEMNNYINKNEIS